MPGRECWASPIYVSFRLYAQSYTLWFRSFRHLEDLLSLLMVEVYQISSRVLLPKINWSAVTSICRFRSHAHILTFISIVLHLHLLVDDSSSNEGSQVLVHCTPLNLLLEHWRRFSFCNGLN